MTKEKKENKWQEDPDIQDFLERADATGNFSEEDDKSFLVAGMSNDKDRDFMKFVKKKKQIKKVLILCTGNSCRSQIADAWLKHFTSDNIEVYSAGTKPEKVNPYSVKVMDLEGIDISSNTSNNIDEYKDIEFNFVITVCDNAKEICPVFPSSAKMIHNSFPDPAKARGTEEKLIKVYSEVSFDLKKFMEQFAKDNLKNK